MTAFAINSGGTVKWDSLSGGSTNATLDTYTISNNSTLLIETDSYQCAGHSSAFGSLDTVSFSGEGGLLKISGKNVRVIPFDTGSGTVPAIGTTISQGGVSGTLLGVWADWLSEPLAAAAAMPTTGYIKIKDKSGDFASGALTGISASATGVDVVGWIEVRGADTAQITVPRVGTFETDGDWFEIGTTNGSAGQVIPCPTTATVAGTFQGVQVETSPGSGVYEWYAGVGTMANLAANPTDAVRGKVFWHTTSGIRFGSDGTNTVGYLPAASCKVRIANIILTCCTRTAGNGSGPRVLPNATLGTRQEFVTSSAGAITMSKSSMQWYASFSGAYVVSAVDCAVSDTLLMAANSESFTVSNALVSPTQLQSNNALSVTFCFSGGTVSGSKFYRASLGTSSYAAVLSNSANITITDSVASTLLNRTGATAGTWQFSALQDSQMNGLVAIGGRVLPNSCQRVTLTNTKYADQFAGTGPSTANAEHGIYLSSGDHLKVDGFELAVAGLQPYSGLVAAASVYDSIIRNIGSFASPIDCGTSNGAAVLVDLSPGGCNGIKVQRCYGINTRTGAWLATNGSRNITFESVMADYGDTTTLNALDSIAKGCRLTPSTTGQNAVYGVHWRDCFTSATAGRIEVLGNEPTDASAQQCAVTSGTAFFNSAGQVALKAAGDQVTWEMPYFALGHTALANAAPTLTGTNTGNLDYEFQYDLGGGYNGTWLTLNATNLNGVGAITPTTGVRLKVRATCNTANVGNLLTNILITTVTTSTDQNPLYPLDLVDVTLELHNIVAGSRYRIERISDGVGLFSGVAASSSVTIPTQWDADTDVRIKVRNASGSPKYIPFETQSTITDQGMSVFVSQVVDTIAS